MPRRPTSSTSRTSSARTGAGAGSRTSSSGSRTGLRARRHQARALRQAGARAAAAFYAEQVARIQGGARRARPRRERPRRARDVPGRRVHRVLPAGARAVPRVRSPTAEQRDLPLAVRPLRDLRLPAALPAAARRRRPPRRSSPGSGAGRPRGSPSDGIDDARDARRRSPTPARSRSAPTIRAETLRDAPPPGRAPAPRPSRGRAPREHLPAEEERGFRRLPAPDLGDVWLDLEGHPFYETARGLEYLFGCCYRDDDGDVVYERAGATRPRRRARRLRGVRRLGRRAPRAATRGCTSTTTRPTSAPRLRRLMGEHGTREQRDRRLPAPGGARRPLPRRQQSLRASVDSYSIKVVEKLYGFERTADVSGGDESTVRFEEWLESGDDSILDRGRGVQRGGLPLHRRAARVAARATARRACRGCRRPTSASAARRPRSATPNGPRCATRCSQARTKATPLARSASSSTTTSARRSRSGGSGSSTSSSTTRSSSRTRDTIGGLELRRRSPSPTSSRSSTRSRSRAQEHKIDHDAVDPAHREDASPSTVDDEAGIVTAPARSEPSRRAAPDRV